MRISFFKNRIASDSKKPLSDHLWCLQQMAPNVLVATIQRCTGVGVSEWTPAGVLTNFENRSGAGVDFFEEGLEPESFFEYEVSLRIIDYYYCRLFFLQSML